MDLDKTPSSKLPAMIMNTVCECGMPITVKVTFGRPTTFIVLEGYHTCRLWEATCKSVIAEAEEARASN